MILWIVHGLQPAHIMQQQDTKPNYCILCLKKLSLHMYEISEKIDIFVVNALGRYDASNHYFDLNPRPKKERTFFDGTVLMITRSFLHSPHTSNHFHPLCTSRELRQQFAACTCSGRRLQR